MTQEDLASPEPEAANSVAFYAALANGGGKFGETTVSFQDLCSPCKRTIRAVLEAVGKKIEGVSPDRKAEKKPREAREKPTSPRTGTSAEPNHAPSAAKASATGVARA